MTPDFLRASLARDVGAAGPLLHALLPAEWPTGEEEVLALRLAQLDREPALQPWLLRGIVLREAGVMVGCIGFHDSPGSENLLTYSARGVEFGFTVFAPFRRRGFAREAALALMAWAREADCSAEFFLSISPHNLASQALASGLGFVRVGSQMDEVDGIEDVLAYRPEPGRPAGKCGA